MYFSSIRANISAAFSLTVSSLLMPSPLQCSCDRAFHYAVLRVCVPASLFEVRKDAVRVRCFLPSLVSAHDSRVRHCHGNLRSVRIWYVCVLTAVTLLLSFVLLFLQSNKEYSDYLSLIYLFIYFICYFFGLPTSLFDTFLSVYLSFYRRRAPVLSVPLRWSFPCTGGMFLLTNAGNSCRWHYYTSTQNIP
jgi:hypothetical protein